MLSRIGRFLGAVALLGVIGASGYYILQSTSFTAPCAEPIVYSVATIDERFGVSESEMRSVLKEAAMLWNTAAGKTVLIEGEDATLPVSLMYDERQATTELGGVISAEQAAYDAKKAEVDRLVAEHETATIALDKRSASYESAKASYEAEVATWNKQGGAPAPEYAKLEEKRHSLERTQASLNAEASRLNAMADSINAKVAELNLLARKVNSKVNTYNQVAGEDFDQGRYIQDENGTRITIYEFENRAQLLRAVAHEFGHALGIEHTENPQSLMYPYNSGKQLNLTSEDIAALKAACDL